MDTECLEKSPVKAGLACARNADDDNSPREESSTSAWLPKKALANCVRAGQRRVKETRYLITSATPQRLDVMGLLETKRGYWMIESALL